MMVDSSGSLGLEGFTTLRTFAANLTSRYQPEFWGSSEMRVGVVLFGNGRVESDGSISKATMAQGLTADIADTKTKISGMAWQRGFTNMAQGFVLADKMLQEDGRSDAQSAVMVFTDGKVNFLFQTSEQAKALRDKNVQIYMAPVTEFKGEELDVMKSLASQPWETNLVRIPGLEALEQNQDMFMQQVIAKFCPRSISPAALAAKEAQKEYMLVRERGFPSWSCGRSRWIGRVKDEDECAFKARDRNYTGFNFGHRARWWRRRGIKLCFGNRIPMTEVKWTQFQSSRRNPDICSSGAVRRNNYFDIYALKPLTA